MAELKREPAVHAEQIGVEVLVEGGWLTLSGDVEWQTSVRTGSRP